MAIELTLTGRRDFGYGRAMEKPDVIAALAALAQDSRLEVYRLLVQAGPDGLAAGQIAARLDVAPNTLSFHFDRLREAGLVEARRKGRSILYSARFDRVNDLIAFLTENCCSGVSCVPVCNPVPAKQRAAS